MTAANGLQLQVLYPAISHSKVEFSGTVRQRRGMAWPIFFHDGQWRDDLSRASQLPAFVTTLSRFRSLEKSAYVL